MYIPFLAGHAKQAADRPDCVAVVVRVGSCFIWVPAGRMCRLGAAGSRAAGSRHEPATHPRLPNAVRRLRAVPARTRFHTPAPSDACAWAAVEPRCLIDADAGHPHQAECHKCYSCQFMGIGAGTTLLIELRFMRHAYRRPAPGREPTIVEARLCCAL